MSNTSFGPHLYESPSTTPVKPNKWGMKALAIAFVVKTFLILLLVALVLALFAVAMFVFRTPYPSTPMGFK